MTDLITRIEGYDFKDPLGHPLKNCVEWRQLIAMLPKSPLFAEMKEQPDRKFIVNYWPLKDDVQGQP